jgi:hypothetical protein
LIIGGSPDQGDTPPQKLMVGPVKKNQSASRCLILAKIKGSSDMTMLRYYVQKTIPTAMASKENARGEGTKSKKAIIYMANADYFKVLCISIQSLRAWHPDISIVVYDVGLLANQKTHLKESLKVKLIEWWPFFQERPFGCNGLLRKILAACSYPLSIKQRLYIIENLAYESFKKSGRRSAELITAQKPFAMLHATDILEGNDILMMDADTAIVGSLNELLNEERIYRVLSREKDFMPRLTKGDCRALYTGLIYICGDYEQKKAFLHYWIKMMASSYEPMSEQTALTRLIQTYRRGRFNWRSGELVELQLGDVVVKLELVDFEKYAAMDYGTRTSNNSSVVHFKGWRHHEENLRMQCREHGLERYLANIPKQVGK